MGIEIREVSTKRDLWQFIHLPTDIHKGHRNWVPPVYADEWKYFNPKENRLFLTSDTKLLLATENGKPAGRIMGIINRKYNEAHGEPDGRFCFLETYDNTEVAAALIGRAESWARQKGMKRIVGPLGFSDKDPQGLLIEGFDEPMVIATHCNYPYMVRLVEEQGYSKKVDLVVYKIKIPENIPEFYRRIYQRSIINNKELRLASIKSRSEIKPYVRPVLTLMNETYQDIYAFTPLDFKEMDEFAKRYLMILEPCFLKILEDGNGNVIAFILAIRDITEGIRRSRGYLFPFGIFQILISQKKSRRLSLLLGAIRKDYRNNGLDTILGISLLEDAQKYGLGVIDSHLILETNVKMRAEIEKMGGVIYKKYRIYQKPL
jgi:GNAT superfamily N-acetyltransferase